MIGMAAGQDIREFNYILYQCGVADPFTRAIKSKGLVVSHSQTAIFFFCTGSRPSTKEKYGLSTRD